MALRADRHLQATRSDGGRQLRGDPTVRGEARGHLGLGLAAGAARSGRHRRRGAGSLFLLPCGRCRNPALCDLVARLLLLLVQCLLWLWQPRQILVVHLELRLQLRQILAALLVNAALPLVLMMWRPVGPRVPMVGFVTDHRRALLLHRALGPLLRLQPRVPRLLLERVHAHEVVRVVDVLLRLRETVVRCVVQLQLAVHQPCLVLRVRSPSIDRGGEFEEGLRVPGGRIEDRHVQHVQAEALEFGEQVVVRHLRAHAAFQEVLLLRREGRERLDPPIRVLQVGDRLPHLSDDPGTASRRALPREVVLLVEGVLDVPLVLRDRHEQLSLVHRLARPIEADAHGVLLPVVDIDVVVEEAHEQLADAHPVLGARQPLNIGEETCLPLIEAPLRVPDKHRFLPQLLQIRTDRGLCHLQEVHDHQHIRIAV
mmetsp:Transcript_41073/g.118098  ORF Transcript_41073/g.118098 Transcript_41073/m.118098 type:complete len:427 (+) Transcript_41073:295-1575(+)